MSGRDRFLASQCFYSNGKPVGTMRYIDVNDEIVSIADQISMLSDLTYKEAYTLVYDAVMDVYESHKK